MITPDWLRKWVKEASWQSIKKMANQLDFLVWAVQNGVPVRGNVHLTIARNISALLARAEALWLLERLNEYRKQPVYLDGKQLLTRDEPTEEGQADG